jgi:hypothetical protein
VNSYDARVELRISFVNFVSNGARSKMFNIKIYILSYNVLKVGDKKMPKAKST